MNKRIFITLTSAAACLFLAACSSSPTTPAADTKAAAPKEPAKPPEAVAAKSAFFEMYKPARQWAPDVMPLTLTAGEVPGIKNEDGKAGQWVAVFVSPSRREARTFYYAVADAGADVHKGVNIGGPQPWSGATPKSKPFSTGEFTTNSDEAYKTAAGKAEAWLKAHPGKKLGIFLASESRFTGPVWYFMWGDKQNGYLAFVSATTGAALK